jgi:hypothetical protein
MSGLPVLQTQEILMRRIRVAGADAAMANFGIARAWLDLDTLKIDVTEIRTIATRPAPGGKKKVVRQNSDDLRRARMLQTGFHASINDCTIMFSEIPSGSQHSRSAFGFGMAIGVLASSPIPLIEVMPAETKLVTGNPRADKPEMIAWAAKLYPELPWLLYEKAIIKSGKTLRNKGDLHDDNEHVADAIAVIHAGIATPEFAGLLSLWKANPINSSIRQR